MLTAYLHLMLKLNASSDISIPPACILVLACKVTVLSFCTYSEAIRSRHIMARSCLLWAAEVWCRGSEQWSGFCCRSHPHGCRVGHQLRDPQCHSRVVWEGRNKRQGGKFTLGPGMLCTTCDPDKDFLRADWNQGRAVAGRFSPVCWRVLSW
jgi:hypothetical protein